MTDADVPRKIGEVIGFTLSERLDNLIHDIVIHSMDQNDIRMSEPVALAMKEMREFMFENVYQNPKAKGEEVKAERLVEMLYEYYYKNNYMLPDEYRMLMEERGDSLERVVCDYISSMSDRFAISVFNDIYMPDSWKD